MLAVNASHGERPPQASACRGTISHPQKSDTCPAGRNSLRKPPRFAVHAVDLGGGSRRAIASGGRGMCC